MKPLDANGALGASLDDVDFVRRLARGLLRDAHLADDVAQDSWTAAVAAERAGDRAWMVGVVRNMARGALRARARRTEHERRAAGERAGVAVDPGMRLDLHRRLVERVGELDAGLRDVIVLRYFEGCSTVEIGRRLKLQPAAVRKRQSRALAQLRARLGEEQDAGDWVRAVAPLAGGTRRWVALGALASAKWAAVGAVVLGVGTWIALRAGSGGGPAGAPPPGDTAAGPTLVQLEEGESRAAGAAQREASATGLRVELAGGSAALSTENLLRLDVVSAVGGERLDAALAWTSDGDSVEPLERRAATGFGPLEPSPGQLLAAVAPGYLPRWIARQDLEVSGGSLELALEPAARLGGRVTFEGGVVPESPVFVLETVDVDRDDDWPAGLAEELAGWLPWREGRPVALEPDGSFQIEGLPPLWRGGLWAGDRYLFDAVQPAHLVVLAHYLPLDTSEPLLEIHLVEPPLLSGRVVWAGDGRPVEEGSVELNLLFADGTKSYRDPVQIGPQGRFSKAMTSYADPYARVPLQSVWVEVWPQGGERTEFEFEALDELGSSDLGSLAVRRVDLLHVVVLDERGAPIEGATVAGVIPRDYGSARAHATTGPEGRVALRGLPVARRSVLIAAPGYRATEFEFGGSRGSFESPREVRLARAVELHVRALGRAEVRAAVWLRVRSDGPLFAAPRLASADVSTAEQVERLREIEQDGWGTDAGWHRLGRSADGLWTLSDLRAGAELELQVLGAHDAILAVDRARVPLSGSIEVELEVDAPTVRFTGRVTDPRGRGIGGVSVRLAQLGGETAQITATGIDGEFDVVQLVDPGVVREVQLQRANWVTLSVLLAPGRAAYDLGTLRLEAARSVQVSVRTADGRDLRPADLWAVLPDGRRVEGSLLTRSPRIGGLPALAAEIHVRVGGRTYSGAVGAAEPAVTIEVPEHGSLRFRLSGSRANYYPGEAERIEIELVGTGEPLADRPADQPWTLDLLPGEYVVRRAGQESIVRVTAGNETSIDG